MYREHVSLPVANMWRSFFECLNDLREEERATFIESITQLMTPRVEFLRTPKASLAGHTQRVNSVAFSPDGQTLVSASQDESAKLWDLQTQTAVSSYRGPTAPTYTAFSPTGARIVLAHHANPGASEIQQAHPTRSTNTAAAPATITVWSPQSGQQLTAIAGHDSDVAWLSFSPDGKKLASASLDLTARVWDTETGAQLLILKGHAQSPTSIATGVWTVAFSPDGKMLATGGSDRTVRLWEAETGRELKTLRGHRLLVFSVAFSPDGQTLASSSEDKTIILWEVATGRRMTTLRGHRDWIVGVKFSPDGKTLASAGYEGAANLWDAQTGELKRTYDGQAGKVHSVAFSPDGKTLASGHDDGTIKLWDV